MLLRDFITIERPLTVVLAGLLDTEAATRAAQIAYGTPSTAIVLGPTRRIDDTTLVGLSLSPAGVLNVLGPFDGDLQLTPLPGSETHVGLVGSHEVLSFGQLSRSEVQRVRTAAEMHARRFLHELASALTSQPTAA